MEIGLAKLYSGDFNHCSSCQQPDGSVIITLSKRGEDKTYRLKVKGLYEENEEVLEHEIIESSKIPKHIKDRMEEAKKWKEEKDKEK